MVLRVDERDIAVVCEDALCDGMVDRFVEMMQDSVR